MTSLCYNSKRVELEDNCGTGAGGFKEGNTCAGGNNGEYKNEKIANSVMSVLEKLKIHAREKTNEKRIAINAESGEIIGEAQGSPEWSRNKETDPSISGVEGFTPEQTKKWIDTKEVIEIHTHPDESSFSPEDWGTFAFSNVKEMIVVTPKGETYKIKKTDKFDKLSVAQKTPAYIKKSWEKLSDRDLRGKPIEQSIFEINKELAGKLGVKIESTKKNFSVKLKENTCPLPTQDIKTNLANRQKAIDVAHYGPANPKEPNEEYWNAKAKIFGGSVKEAKTMRCVNCAGFNQTSKLLDCISKGIGSDAQEVEQAGDLGYCEIFDFKCASLRTCDAWIVGGPITDKTDLAQLKKDLLELKEKGATLLYDPSQQRDESGKWTSQGSSPKASKSSENAPKAEDRERSGALANIAKTAKMSAQYGASKASDIKNWLNSPKGQEVRNVVGVALRSAFRGGIQSVKEAHGARYKILIGSLINPALGTEIATAYAIKGFIKGAISEYQANQGGRSVSNAIRSSVGIAKMSEATNTTNLESEPSLDDVADYLTDEVLVAIKDAYEKNKNFEVVTFYDPSQPRDESGKWSKAEGVISGILNKGWEKIGGPFYEKQFPEGKVQAELKPWFNKDELRISHIETEPKARGKGIGSKALKDIIESADSVGAKIIGGVSATGSGGLTKGQLFKWYEKHGFFRKPYAGDPQKKSDEIVRIPKEKTTNFYDPSQARDESGRWTSEGAPKAEIMVSPNIKENMTFDEAQKSLTSEAQARAVSITKDVIKKQKLDGNIESAIGDWEDGAENSIKISIKNAKDLEQVKYTAAKLGSLMNQKAVVAFKKQANGPDTIHMIEAPKGVLDMRKILSDNGISFRTIVGDRSKTSVTILDKGSQLTFQIGKVLETANATSKFVKGVGEFIGGDTRIQGQKAYRDTIADYERRFPLRPRHGLARWIRPNYYRCYQAIEFYDPSQKRDASGKWTDDGGIAKGATPTPKWAQDNPAEASKKTGEATMLYHGTSADVLKKIREEGLKPSKSGVWGGGKVYSTDSMDLAMEYGVLRSGTAPKIGGKQLIGIISVSAEGFKSVADNIPTTKAQKMGKTGLAAVSKIFTKDGVVEPKAIKKMQIFEVDSIRKYVYENGPKPQPLATKELEDGQKVIYVPIVIDVPSDQPEENQFSDKIQIQSTSFSYNGKKIEFYDPNQPRDEKGRWSSSGGGKSGKAGNASKARAESIKSEDDEDVDSMISRLENEPKAKDAVRKMKQLKDSVAKQEGIDSEFADPLRWSLRDPSRYVQDKDIKKTIDNPTPAHKRWIDSVIESELNPRAKSDNPIAVILMGSPASGKTTTGRPFAQKILGGKETTNIDPDSVKAKSKGFEGWNAGAFHEESSYISEKVILGKAIAERHNVLLDITGKNSDKVANLARTLKSVGYTIGLVHVDVDDKVALKRASARFNKPNGRWVPYRYIKGSAEKARNTWNKLTSEGIADIGYSIDGNAERVQGKTAPIKETHGQIFE